MQCKPSKIISEKPGQKAQRNNKSILISEEKEQRPLSVGEEVRKSEGQQNQPYRHLNTLLTLFKFKYYAHNMVVNGESPEVNRLTDKLINKCPVLLVKPG